MNQYFTKLHWRSSASFQQTTYRERAESRPSQLSGNPRLVAPPVNRFCSASVSSDLQEAN